MAVRVLHCDDSSAFRLLVREVLHDEPGIALVGEAGDATSAVEAASELRPDVVLLDLRGGDLGPDLPTRIVAASPGTKIVVLSGWEGPVDAAHVAARLGKDVDFATLADTLRRVGGQADAA